MEIRTPIRIALADDHRLILQGIQDILKEAEDMNVVTIASTGKELLEKLAIHAIDVALTDIDMPEMSGLDVLEQLKEGDVTLSNEPRFIVLSVHDEPGVIRKAMQLGAHGYLLKKSDPEIILDAIRTVAKGRKYFDAEVIEQTVNVTQGFAFEKDSSALEQMAQLTSREKEIIRLITEGLSNQEIGEQLFISKRTVDTHRNNLMTKLGLKNTVELVKFALKNGLSE